MQTAKVFWSGRSQAVRLPRAFRVDGREVRIRRRGRAIVLEPVPESWEWLDALRVRSMRTSCRPCASSPKRQSGLSSARCSADAVSARRERGYCPAQRHDLSDRAPHSSVPPRDVGVSTVVVHELYLGAFKSQRVEKNVARVDALQFPVLEFDQSRSTGRGAIRAQLASKGTPIGPYDVLIAGQAKARKLTLVTHNTTEFQTRLRSEGRGLEGNDVACRLEA